MSVITAVERFINDEILFGEEQTKLDPDESLLSSGILDSMALLRLVGFIEERFGVTVGDGELIPDNFETINQIEAFVGTKRSEFVSTQDE